VLPAAVFVVVLAGHFLWLGLFPEQDPAQADWVALPQEGAWLRSYLDSQSYWLGYAYALSASFAVAAVRRFRRTRTCASRNLALGGLTFSGALAAAGCLLVGCCGSPMLAVWMSLFGAAFLPFAKPLVAALTTVTVLAAWVWMARRGVDAEACSEVSCEDPLPRESESC